MSFATLILGESGSGKSTSIFNLDPKETAIINVLGKPLPFKGFLKNYKPCSNSCAEGNYIVADKSMHILRAIELIDKNRPDIKNIILDDWIYMITNEFMNRAGEKGFQKFVELAQHAHSVIRRLSECRSDLFCFVLTHSELDADNKYRTKTIGKMLNEKINIEGMFTVVLHALVFDGEHKFLTQNDGSHIAKSPAGMFDQKYINNDLKYVIEKMKEYYGDEVIQSPIVSSRNPRIELLEFLLEHASVPRRTIEEFCQKNNASSIDNLPPEIIEKWIKKLQSSVDMRND